MLVENFEEELERRRAERKAGGAKGIDRESPEHAAQVFEELIPDEQDRRAFCDTLAELFIYANKLNPLCWSVTLYRHWLRMNLWVIEAVNLGNRHFYLLADRNAMDQQTRKMLGPRISEGRYRSVPDADVVTLLVEEAAEVFPLIRDAAMNFVRLATDNGRRRTNLSVSHSPGVSQYLTQFLGRSIPTGPTPTPKSRRSSSKGSKLDWGRLKSAYEAFSKDSVEQL